MKKEKSLKLSKSKDLFSWLKEITWDKRKWESFSELDKSTYNTFLIHRYISMNQHYVELVNQAQLFPHSEKEKIYKFYCEFLPKKQLWLKYIKNNKTKVSENIIKKISEFYLCSNREAIDYLDILNQEDIGEILQKLGIDEKEKKKLLKEIKI